MEEVVEREDARKKLRPLRRARDGRQIWRDIRLAANLLASIGYHAKNIIFGMAISRIRLFCPILSEIRSPRPPHNFEGCAIKGRYVSASNRSTWERKTKQETLRLRPYLATRVTNCWPQVCSWTLLCKELGPRLQMSKPRTWKSDAHVGTAAALEACLFSPLSHSHLLDAAKYRSDGHAAFVSFAEF